MRYQERHQWIPNGLGRQWASSWIESPGTTDTAATSQLSSSRTLNVLHAYSATGTSDRVSLRSERHCYQHRGCGRARDWPLVHVLRKEDERWEGALASVSREFWGGCCNALECSQSHQNDGKSDCKRSEGSDEPNCRAYCDGILAGLEQLIGFHRVGIFRAAQPQTQVVSFPLGEVLFPNRYRIVRLTSSSIPSPKRQLPRCADAWLSAGF
mmetsp:Transcript_11827/g.25353  ORF Transcript_11827/g.25353 Transcript_11827/m.25353 type:complete len:211 (-) Transcript_11827:323-955(-)